MISRTVEYALRATLHLASLPADTAANSRSIARRTRVPATYLSKILRQLVVAEVIRSRRGPTGGFSLARAASRVSILDVVNAVEPFVRIRCCPLGNPAHMHLCPLHRRVDDALAAMERDFAGISLARLIGSVAASGGACRSLSHGQPLVPELRVSAPRRGRPPGSGRGR